LNKNSSPAGQSYVAMVLRRTMDIDELCDLHINGVT